jgi:tRNA(Ile)-lysidine synthase
MKKRRPPEWPSAAGALAALVPRSRVHPGVAAWADGRPRGERWAVALSGGADSVALLLLLWAHWPRRRGRLLVLHFDHRLRGAESTADARFCARLCAALGVPLVSGRWTRAPGRRSEGEARAGRFEFIDREMARRRIRVLWLGHQQDDVAETMLMRLARGSGSGGLAAPRPVHHLASPGGPAGRFHLRPLLGLKKSEIARALLGAGASWREDSSNAKAVHFRNRLRGDVVGRWAEAAGRDAVAGAALSRELIEEDDRALEAWVDSLKLIGAGGSLAVRRLAGRPRAVARRALHRWLLAHARPGGLSRQGFESLLAAVERGSPTRHSLGSEGFAVIRGGRLAYVKVRPKRSAD